MSWQATADAFPTEEARVEIPDALRRQSVAPVPRDLAQSWLSWQCRMIAGVIQGLVLMPNPGEEALDPVAQWPDFRPDVPALTEAANDALSEQQGVVRSKERYGAGSEDGICDLVACPLMVDDAPIGVVAVMMATRSEPQQRAVLQLLQWGVLWLETILRQQAASRKERLATVTDLLAVSLEHDAFGVAVKAVVAELAQRLDCERVSLGWSHGLDVRLEALSHSASFDKRSNVIRDIEAAMSEAIDQGDTVLFPRYREDSGAVMRAHAELADRQGLASVCTVPLSQQGRVFGAITLERIDGLAFDPPTVELCEAAAALIGPILDLKKREARPLWRKTLEAMRLQIIRLLGPGHLWLKSWVLAIAVVVGFFTVAEGDYRITARSSLEGAVQRAVVAPRDGFIASAEVRAGDHVQAGDLLAVLDARDLELERQKWTSQREQRLKEYREALASHDRMKVSILKAQIAQADAELALLDEQLKRLNMIAPFDGVVVTGDLSQSLGAPVQRGDVLFEVAPLEDYRVVVEVDEREIRRISQGQTGRLVLKGMPGESLTFSVEAVTPVAVSEGSANFYRVEAGLEEVRAELRPGMEGIAKLDVGQRKLIWIWTHKLTEAVGLWFWTWWG